MRRKDRQVCDPAQIAAMLDQSEVGRFALCDGAEPYVVPMNFCWQVQGEDLVIYTHCAASGRKLDILAKNANVCFECDHYEGLKGEGEVACAYSARFWSVIAKGVMTPVNEVEERKAALELLMKKMTGRDGYTYAPVSLERTVILKLVCTELSAKSNI